MFKQGEGAPGFRNEKGVADPVEGRAGGAEPK